MFQQMLERLLSGQCWRELEVLMSGLMQLHPHLPAGCAAQIHKCTRHALGSQVRFTGIVRCQCALVPGPVIFRRLTPGRGSTFVMEHDQKGSCSLYLWLMMTFEQEQPHGLHFVEPCRRRRLRCTSSEGCLASILMFLGRKCPPLGSWPHNLIIGSKS